VDPPRAGTHYPRSVGEFHAWFRTDADCLDYLEWLRWPAGFACPGCGDHRGWRLGDGRFMCSACGGRTSVTAGTIFDRTRTPLTVCLLAVRHRQRRDLGAELDPVLHAHDEEEKRRRDLIEKARAEEAQRLDDFRKFRSSVITPLLMQTAEKLRERGLTCEVTQREEETPGVRLDVKPNSSIGFFVSGLDTLSATLHGQPVVGTENKQKQFQWRDDRKSIMNEDAIRVAILAFVKRALGPVAR
jgi:hypothetical protein